MYHFRIFLMSRKIILIKQELLLLVYELNRSGLLAENEKIRPILAQLEKLLLCYLSPSTNDSVKNFFFFSDTATSEIYTLSLHDALPIFSPEQRVGLVAGRQTNPLLGTVLVQTRSEEHTSELQSHLNIVCRLLLEKK